MTTEDNEKDYVILWEQPKLKPPEFRLYYDDNGNVTFKVEYVNGKKRRGRQWDEKGHLIDSRTWDSEEVLVAEYKRYYR